SHVNITLVSSVGGVKLLINCRVTRNMFLRYYTMYLHTKFRGKDSHTHTHTHTHTHKDSCTHIRTHARAYTPWSQVLSSIISLAACFLLSFKQLPDERAGILQRKNLIR